MKNFISMLFFLSILDCHKPPPQKPNVIYSGKETIALDSPEIEDTTKIIPHYDSIEIDTVKLP